MLETLYNSYRGLSRDVGSTLGIKRLISTRNDRRIFF